MPAKFLNSDDRCIVCFEKPEKEFALIKHHVSYYPEVIAFVHYECHKKIHDPEKPLIQFIQYQRDDAVRFYKEKRTSTTPHTQG